METEIDSLRYKVENIVLQEFSDVRRANNKTRYFINHVLKERKGGLWVVIIPLIGFIVGQFFRPTFLQVIPLSMDSSKIIIDQRIANLVTIFSISMVVIGWLFTNISIKDGISYKLLFKWTNLYPIFYFIVALLICLIICSLIRESRYINLSAFVVTGTYLIIIALFLITSIFYRLIIAVGKDFFFKVLEKEVLTEVRLNSMRKIIERVSRKIYITALEEAGYTQIVGFSDNLSEYNGINILPRQEGHTTNGDSAMEAILSPKFQRRISDISIDKLKASLKKISSSAGIYVPVHINHIVGNNFCPVYLKKGIELKSRDRREIRCCYSFSKNVYVRLELKTYQEYINEKMLIEVAEGNLDAVKQILVIYERIYEIEKRINSKF